MRCISRLRRCLVRHITALNPHEYASYGAAALLLAGLYVRRRRDRQLDPKNARVKALLAAADTSSGASNYSDNILKKGFILAQVCSWPQRWSCMHTSLGFRPTPPLPFSEGCGVQGQLQTPDA